MKKIKKEKNMKQTNQNFFSKYKSAGVVLRPDSETLKEKYFIIRDMFQKVGVEIFLENSSAKMINESNGIVLKELCEKVDFLICIGGDGTLLSVARRAYKYNKPVLGINLGNLGFLTDINMDYFPEFLKDLEQNKYSIDDRMMIEGNYKLDRFVALNDIVITRKSISSMLRVSAKIDGKPFNSYYGDGVIISSPTGSTAYNLSAGGPIVYPLAETFIVTAIASHSLTQRPLVMPANFEIEFKVKESSGAVIIVDGQDIYEIEDDESVKIKIASQKAKMLHRADRSFFEVLSEKLAWGN